MNWVIHCCDNFHGELLGDSAQCCVAWEDMLAPWHNIVRELIRSEARWVAQKSGKKGVFWKYPELASPAVIRCSCSFEFVFS